MHRVPAILFAILLAFFVISVADAGVKKTPARLTLDSSKIAVKHFNADSLKHFKADKDFNYSGQDATDEAPSLWTRFWSWLWEKIINGLRAIPGGGTALQYILIAAAVAFLAYIIFKSLGIDAMQILRGRSKETGINYSESLENINEINFDAELEKAIAQHNYRLAVRLLYLRCLKHLSDTQLIQWQIDKTNSAYLVELKDPSQKQMFGMLTRQFEYVWYGNFIIDKDAFGNINALFQNFKKQLP